jgi:hypothetical protein
MDVVIYIIGIVFGILQIILFFKIWGMTNDVKDLKNKFCTRGLNQDQLAKKVLELKYTGNVEEAKKLVDENLENEIFAQMFMAGNGVAYTKSEVERIREFYEKYYKLLNCEMPKEIKEINVGKVVGEYSSL